MFHLHSNDYWFLLNVYAPNSKRERKNCWIKFCDMVQNRNLNKGIIIGDFNTLLTDEEKLGGLALDWDSKLDLSNLINSLALLDVDLLGGIYTWSNKRIGNDCI